MGVDAIFDPASGAGWISASAASSSSHSTIARLHDHLSMS